MLGLDLDIWTPPVFFGGITLGPELIPGGDGSSAAGWGVSFGTGSIVATAGVLRVNSTNAGGITVTLAVAVTPGGTYRFRGTQINGTGTGQIVVGTTSGGSDLANNTGTNGAFSPADFVAPGATVYVTLYNYGGNGTVCDYDNISLKKFG